MRLRRVKQGRRPRLRWAHLPPSRRPRELVQVFIADRVPFLLQSGGGVGGVRRAESSALERHADPLPAAEKDRQPAIPSEQAVDRLARLPDDLRWKPHHGVSERAELHPEHRPLLRRVLRLPTAGLGEQQSEPCLERPRERDHHHVRPVAHQVVHRCVQRAHAALQLREQVLLVAAVVRLEHDLAGVALCIVRDVEEEPHVVEERLLAALHGEVLANHDHRYVF